MCKAWYLKHSVAGKHLEWNQRIPDSNENCEYQCTCCIHLQDRSSTLIYAGNEEGKIRFKKEVTEIKNCFEHCLGKIKKKDSFKMTDLEETMSYFLY